MPFVLKSFNSNLFGQRPTQLKGLSHPLAQKDHKSISKLAGSWSKVVLGDMKQESSWCLASGGRKAVAVGGDVSAFESTAATSARRPANGAANAVNLIVVATVSKQERVREETMNRVKRGIRKRSEIVYISLQTRDFMKG